jgi:hypothetical protein
MSRSMRVALLLLLSSVAGAQTSGLLSTQPKPYVPLTTAQKGQRTLDNMFRPAALIPVVLAAGIAHGRNRPDEWGQELDGFGRRIGFGYGRLVVRNSINLGFHVALRTDPRYDPCQCKGVGRRLGHAVRRSFIVRTDSGGERFHIGNFASAYATNFITNQWLPDRFHNQGRYLRGTAGSIGINMGWNILREFVLKRD